MTTETTTPKRPRFKITGVATIKHLNVRKEGPDDEKILAVDVKLAFEKIGREILAYFEPDGVLPGFLWRGDPASDALIVRNAFLSPLAYAHEITSATVHIDGVWFPGSEVKKFSIQPRDGGLVDITCSVAIYPSSSDIADGEERSGRRARRDRGPAGSVRRRSGRGRRRERRRQRSRRCIGPRINVA